MNVELLDSGWNRSINYKDVLSGRVHPQKFQLSGFRLFRNRVLDYFYNGAKLHLYPNLFKYTQFSAHWYKTSIEYTLEAPLLLSPQGSYISEKSGPNIEFRPAESIPIEDQSVEQKRLGEELGRVFYREVKGTALKLPVDEFLLQLRAPVPELATMLNFLDTCDVKAFKNSDLTDSALIKSYARLEESGKL